MGGVLGVCAPGAAASTASFASAGCYPSVAANVFTVPAGVSSVAIAATGAAGGASTSLAGAAVQAGGFGDGVSATVSGLSAGQKLYVCVGGQGDNAIDIKTEITPGGAAGGGDADAFSGGGGGASAVTANDPSGAVGFGSPLLVAGGGGGGGFDTSATTSATGGDAGQPGLPSGFGGGPGTLSSGGTTPDTGSLVTGSGSTAGGPGPGGDGTGGVNLFAVGGGGGGGYFGGGAGTQYDDPTLGFVLLGGGGGGSDFCDTASVSVSCGTTTPGAGTAAGSVTITYSTASDLAMKLVTDTKNVKPGTALVDKATAIQAAVNANPQQTAIACADITNFLGLVKAQMNKKLSPGNVAMLTTDAVNLAHALGC